MITSPASSQAGPWGPAERIHTIIPRVDAPDRFLFISGTVVKWLFGGLMGALVYLYGLSLFTSTNVVLVFGNPWIWVIAPIMIVSTLGAVVRPGGHDLVYWGSTLFNYWVTPHRSRWKPGKWLF